MMAAQCLPSAVTHTQCGHCPTFHSVRTAPRRILVPPQRLKRALARNQEIAVGACPEAEFGKTFTTANLSQALRPWA